MRPRKGERGFHLLVDRGGHGRRSPTLSGGEAPRQSMGQAAVARLLRICRRQARLRRARMRSSVVVPSRWLRQFAWCGGGERSTVDRRRSERGPDDAVKQRTWHSGKGTTADRCSRRWLEMRTRREGLLIVADWEPWRSPASARD
ncbi:uncharacterized protein M6B38_325275 [Iris pallida]|uniref:Uncharacterized protein n=1 Tax=Iris pallida TaxID=29817 RepID=A0AAX6H7R5_IRIPA|nr:uncharacterized protein M6B38_325275 [Iris pallida]